MTTKEYPPKDIEEFKTKKAENNFFKDLKESFATMSSTMKKLGVIQFFSWFAFFTMWSMATPALTSSVFNAPAPDAKLFDMAVESQKIAFDAANKLYQTAADNVGSAMGLYGLSSMVFALILTFIASSTKVNRKYVHMFSLIAGGIGFLMMGFLPSPVYLKLSFILIGFSWGSILSMPYAMLSSSVDENRMGMMMGLFNMFIVIPQIIAALGGVIFLSKLISPSPIAPMLLAGMSLVIAGLCNFLITEEKAIKG